VDKTQIPVTNLIKSFLMYQEDRNHSPKTVEWYEGMLGRFSRFLGAEATAGQLDIDVVRRYQRFLRGESLSKFTLHAYSRTLKTFLRWLGREAYIDKNLWREIEMPKVPRYEDVTLDVLNDDEIRKLLGLLDPGTDVGCRQRGMVCLMLESGLRLDEVVKLRLEDVRLKEGYVKVRGKGDKEAYVPVGPTTKKALERYQEHFRVPRNAREHAFFLNIFGEAISYSAVQSSFVRLAKRSGISRLHPHLLRHTAATRMLSNGADLHTVQRLLRHSDVRVTLRYLHLIPDQLKERMQLFSPLNGLDVEKRRMVPKRGRLTPSTDRAATSMRPRVGSAE
jgi:integrase/recombinase XerC/integrase/recombinase XerD